jgi:hypothetical protein
MLHAIDGYSAEGEALVGTADVQSLADFSNSFDVVREMGASLVSSGQSATHSPDVAACFNPRAVRRHQVACSPTAARP